MVALAKKPRKSKKRTLIGGMKSNSFDQNFDLNSILSEQKLPELKLDSENFNLNSLLENSETNNQQEETRDRAPKNSGGNPLSKKSKFSPAERQLCKGLTGLFAMGGGSLCMVGTIRQNLPLMMDGTTVLKHADPLATQLIYLGREYPAIMKALQAMVTSSAWVGLATVVSQMGMEIAGNHGWLPSFFGTTEKEMEAGATLDNLGSNRLG
jgi:hypothetical protein